MLFYLFKFTLVFCTNLYKCRYLWSSATLNLNKHKMKLLYQIILHWLTWAFSKEGQWGRKSLFLHFAETIFWVSLQGLGWPFCFWVHKIFSHLAWENFSWSTFNLIFTCGNWSFVYNCRLILVIHLDWTFGNITLNHGLMGHPQPHPCISWAGWWKQPFRCKVLMSLTVTQNDTISWMYVKRGELIWRGITKN